MYVPSCPIPNTRFFQKFETLTDEQSKQQLLNAWSTPEQQKFNAEHEACPTCRGRGYRVHRDKAGKAVRENCGCPTCLGLAVVPKMWPARA